MFTRNSIVLSNNIKTPLTAISRAIGNILQLTYGQLVKQLFSNQEQGFAYDPNDLTDAKINWRRNLLTETEFRNGVSDVPVRGGTITKSTLSGFESAVLIEHGGASNSYAYKPYSVGATVTLSFFVQMTDLSRPVLSSAPTDTNSDFAIIIHGTLIPPANVSIIELPNNIYRMSASIGVGSAVNHGVIKYANHSQKSFKVSGYQLEIGTQATPYQPFTDFNSEFIKQFPLHTLYQDAAGTIPVTAQGQPVGLMLDKSMGLEVGSELNKGAWNVGAGWTIADGIAKLALGGYGALYHLGATTGKFYKITVKITHRAGLLQLYTNSNLIKQINSGGVQTVTYIGWSSAAGNGRLVDFYAQSGFDGEIDLNTVTIKELPGNHAYQSVSASRPVFQQTPILGSELVVNSTFDTGTSGWEGSNGGQLLAVNGEMRLTNTLAAYGRAGCTIPSITGKSYKMSCRLRSGGGTSVTLGVGNNSGSVALGSVYTASTEYVNTSFIFTAQAETTFIIGLIGTTTVGLTAFFDDISVKEIVGYRTDQNYLAFDGVDDFLRTNNIDFTMTDKVSLFSGVRKLSTVDGVVLELSSSVSTNNGSFYLAAPAGQTLPNQITFVNKGTVFSAVQNPNLPPPISVVVTCKGDIAADSTIIRTNGTQFSIAGDLGTGNYGNHPLYIGRRGGTSLPFNGHLYSLIGIGRLTTDSETIALEKAIAKNTGVTL